MAENDIHSDQGDLDFKNPHRSTEKSLEYKDKFQALL